MFSAITRNNFKVAKHLINQANADINYIINNQNDIILYLFNNKLNNKCLLNINNLKFILHCGFNREDSLKFLLNKLISCIDRDRYLFDFQFDKNNGKNIKILITILQHSIYSRDFIIKLLYFYNNKTKISNNQLCSLIHNQNKIINSLYDISFKYKLFFIIRILLNYDIFVTSDDYCKKVNTYYLSELSYKKLGHKILVDILNHRNINFNLTNFEDILICMLNKTLTYGISKFVIDKMINHPYFTSNSLNFEKLINNSFFCGDCLDFVYYIIEINYKNPILNLNKINFEYTLIYFINCEDNISLLDKFIKKLIEYNYNFELINIENVLKEIAHNPYGDKTMKYFLNVIKEKNIYLIENINFKNILIDSYFYNNEHFNTDISKYLLKLMLNINSNDFKNINSNVFKNINIKKLKEYDTKFLTLIINIIIEMGNFEILKILLENEELKSKIDINSKFKKDTFPIINAFYAATNLVHVHTLDNIKIFKFLIDNGADVNVKDENNNTLFSIALYVKNYLFIKLILQKNLIIEENDINKMNDNIISNIFRNNLNFIEHNLDLDKKNETNIIFNYNDDNNNNILNELKYLKFYTNNRYYLNRSNIYELLHSNNDYKEIYNLKGQKKSIELNDINMNNLHLEIDHSYINYSFNPLIISYLLNKKDIFKFLLKNYKNINEVDSNNYTILHYAVLKEDIETIKILLNKKANINFQLDEYGRGHSAFDIFIAIGNEEIFTLLLNSDKVHVNQPNQKEELPICSIIKNPHLSLNEKISWIEKILEKGAKLNLIDVGEYLPICQAIKCHSLSLIKFLVEKGAQIKIYDRNNNTPLIYAILEGDILIIQYFIDSGIDVNYSYNNQLPLEIAIRWSRLEVVKLLVKNGANIDKNITDYYGKEISILGYAIQYNEVEIVDYLISQGAKLNFKNSNNETLYDIAYKYLLPGNFGILDHLINYNIEGFTNKIVWDSIYIIYENNILFFKKLIECGLDINLKNKENETLIEFAVKYNNEEIVEYLIERGVDINMKTKENKSLIEVALDVEDKDMIECLIKHGVDINTKTKENKSLIEVALDIKNEDIIEYLIEEGIDININSNLVDSIMKFAIDSENVKIPRLLIDRGIDIAMN